MKRKHGHCVLPRGRTAGLGAAMMAIVLAVPVTVRAVDPTLLAWGQNVAQAIDTSLKIPGSSLYAEAAALDGTRYGGDSGYAYVWPAATQFRVLNSRVQVDPTTYAPVLRGFTNELHTRYWRNGTGANGGYRSGVSSGATRFYDDNGHLVVSLAEAYRLTGESQYLERAIMTYDFVISGEDDAGGGGIYFSVPDRSSKDAISTLQGARGALLLYQLTGETHYLDDATRLYAWSVTHIQQPNGLFRERFKLTGDNAGMSEGATLTNSAGIGLECNLLFFDVTGDPAYLREAQRIGATAKAAYFNGAGALNDEGFWVFELVDAFNDLYLHDYNPLWVNAVAGAMSWLHANREDPNGHYGRLWARETYTPGTVRSTWELNDQAAVGRSYLYTAVAKDVAPPFATAAGNAISGFYQGSVGGNHVLSAVGTGAGQYPAAEAPSKAIDRSAASKYLNFGNGSSSVSSPTKGVGTGFCVTPAPAFGASLVTGLQVVTAADAPNRDPLVVSIEGTNATTNFNLGSTWTLIADGVNLGIDTDPGRQAYGPLVRFDNAIPYRSYRVIVQAQRGSDNSVQYAELNLVGVAVDLQPPGPVSAVSVTASFDGMTLAWTNPADADFAGVRVVVKTTGYPIGPEDGELLVDRAGLPGGQEQFVHAGIVCGTAYYYALFAYDQALNYAATPVVPLARLQCGDFDFDADVDQDDFGFFQRCLSGAGINAGTDCAPADMDGDHDVDAADLELFRPCMGGANQTPGC